MKACASLAVFILACLLVQDVKSAPDMQEFMEKAKETAKEKAQEFADRAHELAAQAQDAASKAADSIRTQAQEAAASIQQTGQHWIEQGKEYADSLSSQASQTKPAQ